MFYTYLLRCEDHSLYAGITTDPARRFAQHCGKLSGGAKYTGVTDEILDSIDVLVDGRFILAQKNLALRFRGSENQRIIDMKRTRAAGEVILHPLNC